MYEFIVMIIQNLHYVKILKDTFHVNNDNDAMNFLVTQTNKICTERLLNETCSPLQTLPGLYLSVHVNTPPCLHIVSIPHRSLVTTLCFTGLQGKV